MLSADRTVEHVFIGREEVLGKVVALFAEPGKRYRLRASGAWGIGKTYLIDELERRCQNDKRVISWRVRAGLSVPDAVPQKGAEITTETKLRNFQKYAAFLAALAGRDPPGENDVLDRLRVAVEVETTKVAKSNSEVFIGQFHADVHAGGNITAAAGAVVGGINIVLPPEPEARPRLDQTIENSLTQLKSVFVQGIDSLGEYSGTMLLIDEFEKLDGHPIQDWIVDMVAGLEKTIVVLTAWRDRDPPIPDANDEDLRAFSIDEVSKYLVARLGREVTTELAERVHRFSAGLPQAVAMAVDLIERRGSSTGTGSLSDLVFDEGTPAVTTLLSTIVSESDSADATLLREGRFARRIDKKLIHHLLFGTDPSEATDEQSDATSLALKHLLEYSFVETYDADDVDGIGRYRFHEYVSRAEAPKNDDTLDVDIERVHQKLAGFYEMMRDKYEEKDEDKGSYLRWYKYEQPRWQAMTREWLYHTGRVGEDARRTARLELLQIFLEAFWWWGCYVHFDFIDKLLDDWERTQPDSEADWLARLREIQRSYPVGYRKLDQGDWQKVEIALRWIRTQSGVDGSVPLAEPDGASAPEAKRALNLRRVRAFTSLFLAHSYRFRTGSQDRAVTRYEDALRYMTFDDAAVAWTTFEFAELCLELNDLPGARTRMREAARRTLEGDEDWELRANLHRLRADIESQAGGEAGVVLDAMANAIERAFIFLLRPNPPDPYTVTFYQEMRERLADRLAWLLERDEAALTAALPSLLKRLAPLGAAQDTSLLIAGLRAGDHASTWPLLARIPPVPSVADPDLETAVANVQGEIEESDADKRLAAP